MNEENKSLSNTIVAALRARNLTVGKLAEATGVSERFLDSIVEERFDNLPPFPYVRGYLRKVGDALGLDGEELIREYLEGNEAVKRSGKNDRLPENRFEVPKLKNKIIVTGVVVLFVLLYAVFRTPLFGDVSGLTLRNLDDEITYSTTSEFTVSGKIGSAYKLTLNGEKIYPDEKGNFSKEIKLNEGFNTLVFEAKKFLGKESTVTKQIFYQSQAVESSNQNGEE